MILITLCNRPCSYHGGKEWCQSYASTPRSLPSSLSERSLTTARISNICWANAPHLDADIRTDRPLRWAFRRASLG